MRPGPALALVGVVSAVAIAPAVAFAAGGGHPRVSATPRTVHFGQQQTVSGHGWAVIEFCRRTVRLSLVSAQNVADIGTARIRDDGTFTRRWTPRRAAVGAGDWNLRVTQRCESGKDGSTIFVRRAIPIHIR
jgi:hypothetical protein